MKIKLRVGDKGLSCCDHVCDFNCCGIHVRKISAVKAEKQSMFITLLAQRQLHWQSVWRMTVMVPFSVSSVQGATGSIQCLWKCLLQQIHLHYVISIDVTGEKWTPKPWNIENLKEPFIALLGSHLRGTSLRTHAAETYMWTFWCCFSLIK